jgi:hypothetical protein
MSSKRLSMKEYAISQVIGINSSFLPRGHGFPRVGHDNLPLLPYHTTIVDDSQQMAASIPLNLSQRLLLRKEVLITQHSWAKYCFYPLTVDEHPVQQAAIDLQASSSEN